MTNEEIYEKLNEVFRNVFMDDTITVNPDTNSDDISTWDSLMHITLLSEIESAFGIEFTSKEEASLKKVGDIADIIAARKS